MLHLSGLSLKAKIGGTVTIYAVPFTPPYFGGTARQRLCIESDLGEMLIVEDQIIEAEVN